MHVLYLFYSVGGWFTVCVWVVYWLAHGLVVCCLTGMLSRFMSFCCVLVVCYRWCMCGLLVVYVLVVCHWLSVVVCLSMWCY